MFSLGAVSIARICELGSITALSLRHSRCVCLSVVAGEGRRARRSNVHIGTERQIPPSGGRRPASREHPHIALTKQRALDAHDTEFCARSGSNRCFIGHDVEEAKVIPSGLAGNTTAAEHRDRLATLQSDSPTEEKNRHITAAVYGAPAECEDPLCLEKEIASLGKEQT